MGKKGFLDLRIPPPVVFALFACCMWLVSRSVPGAHFLFPAKRSIAAVTALLGGVFGIAGIASFLSARTTLNPHRPDRSAYLVTTGVYAVTRNPMYLALLLGLIGWAVYLSNLASFPLPAFFAAYVDRFQIRPEERTLVSLFGNEFRSYCNKVGRWF